MQNHYLWLLMFLVKSRNVTLTEKKVTLAVFLESKLIILPVISEQYVATSRESRQGHEMTDSHIVLVFPRVIHPMSRRMLAKSISFGSDHRGCSCLFIVHRDCLHGSDAEESIAALEQTSEQQTVDAGLEWEGGCCC